MRIVKKDIEEMKTPWMKVKKPKKFRQVTEEQAKVISEKGKEAEFSHRFLLGPYCEVLNKKLKVAYIGLYKNGKKDGWGKMVKSG